MAGRRDAPGPTELQIAFAHVVRAFAIAERFDARHREAFEAMTVERFASTFVAAVPRVLPNAVTEGWTP